MTLDQASLDARDRAYVDTLVPAERAVVVETLARHRRQDAPEAGDRLPDVDVHELEDGARVPLAGLAAGRPLVLVFGSFT